MFDTYVTRRETQYVDRNITHHEHRAPTDESIKILREMEAKARDNLLLAIRVPDGPIPMAVHVTRDFLGLGCHVGMKLRINGKEKLVQFTLEDFDMSQDLYKFTDKVRDKAFGALITEFGPALLEALLGRTVKPDAISGARTVSV